MDLPPDPPAPKSFRSFFFGQKSPFKENHSSANQTSRPSSEAGLKTLTHHEQDSDHPAHRSLTRFNPNIQSSSSSFSSASFTKEIKEEREENDEDDKQEQEREEEENDDCEQEQEREEENGGLCSWSRKLRQWRQFPPPIPSLARTGNLHCHMPWILKRSYQSDGRLVIQEIKVPHHEFFRARRENGRLTLQLVRLEESRQDSPEPENPNDPIKNEKTTQDEKQTENFLEHHLPPPPPPPPPPPSSGEAQNRFLPISDHPRNHALPPSSSLRNDNGLHDYDHDDYASTISLSSSTEEKFMTMNPIHENIMPSSSSTPMLASSLSESSLSGINKGGGNTGGCSSARRLNSLFQMPMPTIRPVHS